VFRHYLDGKCRNASLLGLRGRSYGGGEGPTTSSEFSPTADDTSSVKGSGHAVAI